MTTFWSGKVRDNLVIEIHKHTTEAQSSRRIEKRAKKQYFHEIHHQCFKHGKDEPKPEPRVYTHDGDEEVMQLAFAKYWNLHHRRTTILRREARIMHLANSFLKGRAYAEIENKTHNLIHSFEDQKTENNVEKKEKRIFSQVWKMILKYSDLDIRELSQKWAEWEESAKEYILEQQKKEVLEVK